jgi:hypothetical protein
MPQRMLCLAHAPHAPKIIAQMRRQARVRVTGRRRVSSGALCARRLYGDELDEATCTQLAVPLEALDRFGSMLAHYRGDVAACAAFEGLDIARQLAHWALVGAWIGGWRAAAASASAGPRCLASVRSAGLQQPADGGLCGSAGTRVALHGTICVSSTRLLGIPAGVQLLHSRCIPDNACRALGAACGDPGDAGIGKMLLLALAVLHAAYALLSSLLKPYSHNIVGAVQQATNWLLAAAFVLVYLAHQPSIQAGPGVSAAAADPARSASMYRQRAIPLPLLLAPGWAALVGQQSRPVPLGSC